MAAAPGIVTTDGPPNAVVQIQGGMNVQPVVLVDQNGNYVTTSGSAATAGYLADLTGTVNVAAATAPTTGQVLTATGTSAATWQAAFTNPMTTAGDLIAENTVPTAVRVAGNTTATKNFLTQTGTGTVSALPAWGTIAAGDMPTGTTAAKGALQLDGTATDILPDGTQAAGGNGLPADSGHVHPENLGWTAADQGFKAWNYDPANAGYSTYTTNPAAGTIYLARINIREAMTITKIAAWWIAGTGTAASNTYLGLYTSAGAELGVTSDFSASSTATVLAGLSIGSQSLTAGYYYVAFLIGTQFGTNKGGCVAAESANVSGAGPNAGLAAAALRWGINGTGQSALPTGGSAFTLSSSTAIAYSFWCALL